MPKSVVINVFEVVGSTLCVASDDGQKVHDQIAAALQAGQNVILSFANITDLTSAFLNAAVGQLYADFSEQKIRAGVSVCDMKADDVVLLKRVVDTAKQYFKDPKRFQKVIGEVTGGGAN
jgi:hypothetical protein